ncbi:translation initiation factor 3 subunit M [Clonorchis sinensis]|uniref:Translation initiation factor 3 subunit M n=1 Tax=Clonorchis sinensis TaxID=79923 RepID=G7YPH6_CLOSI|nr:translation initiation factor 3 subunit M [Clonorchis sinensis]
MHGEKGPEDITRIDAEKDLGIWLSPNMSFSRHLEKSAQKSFAVLRMILPTFSRVTRTDLQILYGAYVRPLLEFANPVVYSGRTKDVILIERVQLVATKMVAGLKFVDYETRLAVLDLFLLEYRRLRGDLILTYALFEQGLTGRFFTVDPANTRRGHDKKILSTERTPSLIKFSSRFGRTKDVILIERVQLVATKMVAGLKFVDYETRLAVLDLFLLEYRRLRGDLILTYALFEQGLTGRLNLLFHGLRPDDHLKCVIYVTLVLCARKLGLVSQIIYDPKKVTAWLAKCQCSVEERQNVWRILYETHSELGETRRATEALVYLLSTFTEATAAQARQDAIKCIISVIQDPSLLAHDQLHTLKPIQFLEGEPVHDVSLSDYCPILQFFKIFVSGNLATFKTFLKSHPDFLSQNGLDEDACLHKLRLLTLMQLSENQMELSYDAAAKELELPLGELEPFIIEAVRQRSVACKLDQVNRRILITGAFPRTFGRPQWAGLRDTLIQWHTGLGKWDVDINPSSSTKVQRALSLLRRNKALCSFQMRWRVRHGLPNDSKISAEGMECLDDDSHIQMGCKIIVREPRLSIPATLSKHSFDVDELIGPSPPTHGGEQQLSWPPAGTRLEPTVRCTPQRILNLSEKIAFREKLLNPNYVDDIVLFDAYLSAKNTSNRISEGVPCLGDNVDYAGDSVELKQDLPVTKLSTTNEPLHRMCFALFFSTWTPQNEVGKKINDSQDLESKSVIRNVSLNNRSRTGISHWDYQRTYLPIHAKIVFNSQHHYFRNNNVKVTGFIKSGGGEPNLWFAY